MSNTIYDYKLKSISGNTIDLSAYKSKKILLVNTASACGLTPQYAQLQELHELHNNIIQIIGLPCNDFGEQEPGTESEVAQFCEANYQITFPLTAKVKILGDEPDPVYTFLTKKDLNGYRDSEVKWNFQKYLMDETGHLIKIFAPIVSPLDEEFLKSNRDMKFEEVVGQYQLKQSLIGMVQSEKIPHAMMFLGPEGNGALPLSLALSQYVLCANKDVTDSCGTCPSCLKMQKFVHPDLHFSFPVIKPEKQKEPPISADYITEWRSALASQPYMSGNDWLQNIKAENKLGNITVRECHEIIRHLSLKTYESKFKIQIIWLAEYLKEAGNTLLKIIEEPPADTIFILIVENIEQMLNTIVSRTQIIKVNPLEDADIKQTLLSRFETDMAQAERITRIADGNFNAALNYANGEETENDTLLHKWFGYCFNLKLKPSGGNTRNLFDWVDEISKIGRENQKLFLKYALFFVRECSLIVLTGKSEKLDGEELKFATNLSGKLSAEQMEWLSQILSLLHYYIERNGNPKTLFISNSFKIASVFGNEELALP